MNLGLLADFFMDIKNWIFNWDSVTFAIVIVMIVLLMGAAAVSFVKGLMPKVDKKPKIRVFSLIFLILLIVILIIILLNR